MWGKESSWLLLQQQQQQSYLYTFFFCFCLNFLLIWIFCCFLLVFPFFCFLPGFAGGLPPDLDGSLQQTNVRPGAKQHTRPPGRLCFFGYPEYHQNKCFYFFIFWITLFCNQTTTTGVVVVVVAEWEIFGLCPPVEFWLFGLFGSLGRWCFGDYRQFGIHTVTYLVYLPIWIRLHFLYCVLSARLIPFFLCIRRVESFLFVDTTTTTEEKTNLNATIILWWHSIPLLWCVCSRYCVRWQQQFYERERESCIWKSLPFNFYFLYG